MSTRTLPAGLDLPPEAEPPEPPLRPLLDRWARHPLAGAFRVASESSFTVAVPEGIRAFWLAGLPALTGHPVVAVLPGAADLERTARDVAAFTADPCVIDAWETLPYEHVSPSLETMGRRLAAFRALRSPSPPPLTLLSVRALLQRLAPGVEDVPVLTAVPGAALDLEDVAHRLVAMGYERTYLVEARGEFAVRGGILDVFPATAPQPVRVELWGDEVETVRRFSVSDQRSVETLGSVDVLPCRELRPDEAMRARAAEIACDAPGGRDAFERIAAGEVFAGMESWLPWLVEEERTVVDLLAEDALVVVCDPKRCLDRAADLRREEEDLAAALATTWRLPHSGGLAAVAAADEAGEEAEAGDVAEDRDGDGAGDGAAVAGDDGEGTAAPASASPQDVAVAPPPLFVDAPRALAAADLAVWQAPVAADSPDARRIGAGVLEPSLGDPAKLAAQFHRLLAGGVEVVVAADGDGSAVRIRDLLAGEGLALAHHRGGLAADPGGGVVLAAPLERGFVSQELGLALVAEADLTGRHRVHRRSRPTRRATPERDPGRAASTYGDLAEGDYVVHYHHGVGRFEGMVRNTIGGVEREYLLIAYSGHDRLYVPVDQVDAVRKYVGGDTPRLSRMGGADWTKTKSRVRKAVAEVAAELVSLYRTRITTPGRAFSADGEFMARLVGSFPYDETPDQIRAIGDVTDDMETPVPMDRLVCGDVGYGKTEIAIRAALKAVVDGTQVGVLVPTTVLAQQHFQTFGERYAELPVRVEMLSRFLTSKQQKAVVADVAAGRVDVVIGTHRLLQDDVAFARLGLLVVDEEQRFGVQAKERIKALRENVDVLTMTATPIPRTLEFALTGIRDMSIVNTPPEDRRPVLTYVGGFDEQAVAAAIRRELLRDGQVFFVHNRVRSIDRAVAQLRALVPEARIGVAHGQMDEASLERVMLAFWDGEHDVLVSTTIIENGLDIARANTLVVERADLLGLAQLYQLRGRVGRSRERAYAYLFYPPQRVLTEEAHERLKVIAEHQDLGSGFAIAMRDLEMRGAGNLLGAAQSGHIAAVGFDLYCQLVNEAVAAVRGESVPEPSEVRLDLPLEAFLPAGYVPKESLRLEAYRRLGEATSEEEIGDVALEWADRYGALPEPATNLLALARVKVAALAAGVREIVFARRQARLSGVVPVGARRMRLERTRKAVVKEDQGVVAVPFPGPDADAPDWTLAVLSELAGTGPP